VAKSVGPRETETGGKGQNASGTGEGDLEQRRRQLEASLAARKSAHAEASRAPSSRTGYGQALKLSSEFIAGIAVGTGLGWFIDRVAGTSPWGLIVFLLLGFAAGVLNVMRSAGVVAEAGIRAPKDGDRSPEDK
jgi:ATP synthase protein I